MGDAKLVYRCDAIMYKWTCQVRQVIGNGDSENPRRHSLDFVDSFITFSIGSQGYSQGCLRLLILQLALGMGLNA